jgi:hypothetical protein
MTTMTSYRNTPPDTIGAFIPANRTPRISDLVPGAVIFRWATPRTLILVSELPCHSDQMASVTFDPANRNVEVDQPVVCRRCFATYAATPVPAASDDDHPKIVYRHTGRVTMSRPKRSGE